MHRAVKRTTVKALQGIIKQPAIKPDQQTPQGSKTTRGFSLVELLVVVAILAILAAIAIPLFLNQRSKAAQGAVQSDARNLATNLNTLFTNLPRSADPNVALNGGTAPNVTLSGSGTISVGGETLNVNLSPDVTITKTGNADPAEGAGLKITHAGVENWACVIPLPFSVAYAQTMTFQQTCGTIVSEVGNLLTLNQATIETDITGLSGYANATVARSTADAAQGLASFLITATGTSGATAGTQTLATPTTSVSVTSGQTYTAVAVAKKKSGTDRQLRVTIRWYNATGSQISIVDGPSVLTSNSAWTQLKTTATAPAAAAFALVQVGILTPTASDSFFTDQWGFWQGTSGLWVPPGVPIVE